MHIIEEMIIFRDSRPVQHMELDTEKVGGGDGGELVCFQRSFPVTNNELCKCIYEQFTDSARLEAEPVF